MHRSGAWTQSGCLARAFLNGRGALWGFKDLKNTKYIYIYIYMMTLEAKAGRRCCTAWRIGNAARTSERQSGSAQFKVLWHIAGYSTRVVVWPRIDSVIVEARLDSLIVGLVGISGIFVTNGPPSDEVQVLAIDYFIIT